MKRWVVVLLVVLAVLLLLSPGIVGRMAERNLNESLDWIEQEGDDVVVTSESFERGWFTSEGRHRIELSDHGLARLLGSPPQPDTDQPPTLVVDTHIDHGIVPFTSLGRERGSLVPGIASSVSTMLLEYENGETVDVPGKVYSSVGLTGSASHRYVTGEGSRQFDGASVAWQGADITMTSDASRRVLTVDGRIEPFTIDDGANQGRFGRITLSGRQDKRVFALGVGDGRFEIEGIEASGPDLAPTGIGHLTVEGSNSLDGDRVGGNYSMRLDELDADPLGKLDFQMAVTFGGLHAASLEALIEAVDDARLAPAEPAEIEPEVAALMARGGRLTVDSFSFRLPQGELRGSMDVDVPGGGDPAQFNWASLLLAMKARMDITIDAPLYDFLVTVQPEFATATAMGFLSASGDTYDLKAEFGSGLLTINGAPLPVPLAPQ